MNTQAKVILGLAGVILLAGIGLVILGTRPPPAPTFNRSVKDLLPKPEEIPGWSLQILPIASTPEMKAKVAEVLNYDDAVFAVYSDGVRRVSVYIAYWRPGRMRYRDIAGHTPDRCWVDAGWSVITAQSGVLLSDGNGGKLLPAEERTMNLNGMTEDVAFWHLLDGHPMSYGIAARPPRMALIADLFKYKLNLRPEQFFIRISSNTPFEEWSSISLFRHLANNLPITDT